MQSEIPEDVMKAAQDAFAKLADTYGSSAAMVFPIARAIMTERERHVSTILTGEMIEAAKSAYSECEFRTDEQVNSSITLIVRAALEAALSTDAEPAIMDDEDRTPTPAGFDDALWRKADEVHHAMALVARDQECVKIIYAALSTHNAEPVKTAPAVAVKALEWVEGNPGSYTEIAESPFGHYSVWEINGTGCWSPWKQGSGSIVDGGLAGAKAAAQADYEARILSSLSAQVQDVAGWQSMDSAPTDGSEFVAGRRYAPDGEFVVHTYKWVGEPNYWSSKRNGVCIRPQYQDDFVWCPLPASPASKHGDAE